MIGKMSIIKSESCTALLMYVFFMVKYSQILQFDWIHVKCCFASYFCKSHCVQTHIKNLAIVFFHIAHLSWHSLDLN